MPQRIRQTGSGGVGPGLSAANINAMIGEMDEIRASFTEAQKAMQVIEDLLEFFAAPNADPTTPQSPAGWPLGSFFHWDAKVLDNDNGVPTGFIDFDRIKSQPTHGVPVMGFLQTPPNGKMTIVRDAQSVPRAVYTPAISLHAVTMIPDGPIPNVTYTVTMVDLAFTASDMTPFDRIPGVPYSTTTTHGMLMVPSPSVLDIRLYAFEPPDLAVCPPPPQATAAFGGFAV